MGSLQLHVSQLIYMRGLGHGEMASEEKLSQKCNLTRLNWLYEIAVNIASHTQSGLPVPSMLLADVRILKQKELVKSAMPQSLGNV